jgi:anti-sigma regulatory factor (Ser/Thr protein kinase)
MDELSDELRTVRVARGFTSSPDSVTQARRYVQEQLHGVSQDVSDAVAVMTSELATNSIRHAGSDFEVGVERGPDTIRVEVTDRGSGAPTVRSPDATSPSGRGLFIVEQLSDSWGVDPARDRRSKTVWFTVALLPAS